MITFKRYIVEQEDKATPGFDKDKGGNVFIAPVIANETVFVMTNSAKLIAFR